MPPGTPPAATSPHRLFGDVTRNWGWMLALGVLSVVLGVIGLGMAAALTIVSVLYFGVLMIIGGAVQIFQAFKCSGWKSAMLHGVIGLLYVIAGIMIVMRPLEASIVLTWTLAVILVAVGVLRLIMAFQNREMAGAGWAIFGGIVTVILGIMILARWPFDALWVIGMLLAIELIVNGWTLIAVALAARAFGGARPAPGAARA
ncbi:MAG TPA: HdeD family acid-resistance protein [Candidatus Binatia bacterium]|nr:HdeD family acid-resistance protein [Candidatus Binatia bacterium]